MASAGEISIVLLMAHLHQYSFCSLQYINDNFDPSLRLEGGRPISLSIKISLI
jgi:hypothetical protein